MSEGAHHPFPRRVEKYLNVIKKQCKGSSRHISGLQEENYQAVCLSQNYPQNVSRYLSCLTETAIAGAIIIPPVLGKGIRIGSLQAKVKVNKEKMDDFKFRIKMEESSKFDKLISEFSREEMKIINPYFRIVDEKKIDPLFFHRILRYSRTLSAEKRMRFLDHLDESLERNSDSINRQVRRFLKKEERYEKRVARLEKKYRKNLLPPMSKKWAMKMAKSESHYVEDVLMSCRARNMNVSHKRSIKLFNKITMGLVMGGTAAGYAHAHWNLPKNAEWFGILGYEMVYMVMQTKILLKVFKNPADGPLKRYVQFNVGAVPLEAVDAVFYAQLFDMDEKEAQDAINRIKNSPRKMKALDELSQYLDRTHFVEHFKQYWLANMKNMLKAHHEEIFDNTSVAEDGGVSAKLQNLSEEDLDDPEIQDELLEAAMAQHYDSQRGYFNMGGIEGDRFAYNRGWNALIGIPKNIAFAWPMYHSLCLTAVWPVRGLAAAAGIQAINQLTSADWYYLLRKYFINQ